MGRVVTEVGSALNGKRRKLLALLRDETARVAFNWGLARVKAVMDQRAAEATYNIAGTA